VEADILRAQASWKQEGSAVKKTYSKPALLKAGVKLQAVTAAIITTGPTPVMVEDTES